LSDKNPGRNRGSIQTVAPPKTGQLRHRDNSQGKLPSHLGFLPLDILTNRLANSAVQRQTEKENSGHNKSNSKSRSCKSKKVIARANSAFGVCGKFVASPHNYSRSLDDEMMASSVW